MPSNGWVHRDIMGHETASGLVVVDNHNCINGGKVGDNPPQRLLN